MGVRVAGAAVRGPPRAAGEEFGFSCVVLGAEPAAPLARVVAELAGT
ncbi:hypothetical protein G5V58_18240 [Nocardioides anomalus]|uniref:Uncharacterized protein n=1 Tax=Nocardioides anomalus TaxID=2712223 RepID=A0A6G6WGJ0_9ACTN|nr:hypothetical protein [Nocardioides anomalus]QIG44461.1 hypothetical protein G5V58_18240 [Nocardioides anomalus]